MHFAICSIGLVLASATLVGCGQSGNLQLANSQDYDKRAKYLLYSKDDSKATRTEEKVNDQLAAPDQAVPVSQASSN